MKWSKPIVLSLVSFALLTLIIVCLWRLDVGGVAELAAARERVRAAGLPMTVAEIQPPFVPDADNARPLILRFSSNTSRLVQKFISPNSKLSQTELDQLAAEFDTAPIRAELSLIRAAAAKPGYSDTPMPSGPASVRVSSDVSSPLMAASRLLGAHARLAVSRGEPKDAYDDVQDLLQLADFMAKEPTLLKQLVRSAIASMAIDRIQELVAAGNLPPEWNQNFSERLAGMNLAKGLALGLDGERMTSVFEGLLSGATPLNSIMPIQWSGFDDPVIFAKTLKYRFRSVIRSEDVIYLDWMRQMRMAVAEPNSTYANLDKQAKAASARRTTDQFLVRRATGNLDKIIKNAWAPVAKLALAQAGLALERHRATKGVDPTTFAELTPEFLREVPADPFTGKPLLYRRDAGGAMIWSTGTNLRDDGDTGDDIIWRAKDTPK